MTDRLEVTKTFKLYVGGAFPRSESGRTRAFSSARGLVHIAHASRKDFRDAVEAARRAQSGWAAATAYNRGQVLYRMAEMLESRHDEFVDLLATPIAAGAKPRRGAKQRRTASAPRAEVAAAIDRLVCFGGWADKYAQVLGCNNPVAGPYYNFTVPEPSGVVGVVAPDEPALLGLVSLLAPPLCAGNTIVALGGESNPLPAAVLGEVCATSDVPPGVVNILTGSREELIPHVASHREVDAVFAAGLTPEHAAALRAGTADNLKRITVLDAGRETRDWYDEGANHCPWRIEPFVEMKTIWHPAGA
jgi:acyl-CoA reductase-like NAD-dependent aldehyde dehydrogenase